MVLKIQFLPKLLENQTIKKISDALNEQELDFIFVNLGKIEGKDSCTYGVYCVSPLDKEKFLQIKARSSNGNSLFIVYAKEVEKDLVPTKESEQIKRTCKVEVGKNFLTRDREFSNFTFDIEDLPITKMLSKSDRDKEVKIWETYIKAFKAFYKNQEELLKIIDIGQPNKGIVDIKIEKEDWKKILISELGNKYPQFPLINEIQNSFEFAYNNTSSSVTETNQQSEDEDTIDTKETFEGIKETIKENFFKIVTNPTLVSRSFIKLNFFNKEQKSIVSKQISEEVSFNFPETKVTIGENLDVSIKLEDVQVLQSVITQNFPTLELSPISAIFKYKVNSPVLTIANHCQNTISQIIKSYNDYTVTPLQDYKQISVTKSKAFISFTERTALENTFKLKFEKTCQEISFPNNKNIPQITGTTIKGNTYSYKGNTEFVKNKSEEIKKTVKGFWQVKTSYIFNVIFDNTPNNQLDKDTRLALYNEFGKNQKVDINKAEITLNATVNDYSQKFEKLKKLLADNNIEIEETEFFNLSIKQKLEEEDELTAFIEKAIKRPLLSEYQNNVKFVYNNNKQIIELEWKESYSNQQLLQSMKQIVNNSSYKDFFKHDTKIEISQILTFKAELEMQKVNEFERKRQYTFAGKGSALFLDSEQAYQFENQKDVFSDDDLGSLVGNIQAWERNKVSIKLLPILEAAIKSENSFNKNDLNLADFEEWIGNYIKPTLSGDLTQNRRLEFAIERILYPPRIIQGKNLKRRLKNNLTLYNPRLPDFIFDASQARPISDEEIQETDKNFTALNRLNPKQKDAVLRALNAKDLFILQGPPGTGKTTVISEIIYQLLKRNPKTKILLTSQTHLAVDNALERLSGQNIVKPLRLGSNVDSFEEEGKKYFKGNIDTWVKALANTKEEKEARNNPVFTWINNIVNSSDKESLDLQPILKSWREGLLSLSTNEKELFNRKFKFNVIGATCSFTGNEKAFSKVLEIAQNPFDYVIFDEASKATPPELLIPLLAGKITIIIGDHKQLPPLIEEDTFADKLREIGEERLAQEIGDAEVEKSQFEKLFRSAFENNKSIITTLDTQFRMHNDIMQVINQFYQEEGGLCCGLPNDKMDLPDFNEKASRYHGISIGDNFLTPENHILWVDTTSLEQKINTTYSNEGEIEAIDQLLSLLKKSEGFNKMQKSFSKEEQEIGIITFYGGQLGKLKTVREKHKDLPIRVNTVDKFQGMERNIIIVSTVRNNEHGKIGFAEKLQRINVALSRAKRLLIVVGNINHFADNKAGVTYYKEIKRILESKGSIRTQKMLNELIKNGK